MAVGFVMLLAVLPAAAFGAGTSGAARHSAILSGAPVRHVLSPGGSSAPTFPASAVRGAPQSLHAPQPGHFVLPGPHLKSWGPGGVPPGAEAIASHVTHLAAHAGATAASSASSNWDNRFCAGLWPGFDSVWGYTPQGAYGANCYGHDEPGVQFYSTLPGSGGNVSWNVTLPVDRSATLNQSSLYSAIWFGMALSDPLGWINQCFLELQFYPDQTWYNPGPLYPNATVNGAWVGAAVAWQIEAATGNENPCFYEPLFLNGHPGPAYLNMTQGDRISVRMTGWAGSATGEQITINDVTNGQMSAVTLFDAAGGFPLNPAYSTNSYPAAFQWTPGGEYPIAFAFETGHAGNPNWPANNSFGGCSGGPKSTPQDPGAPCPSYDPGSWVNDTLRPWQIDAPFYYNAHAWQGSSQVAFTQPEGGMNLVDQTSNGTCTAVEGSAWCSYPWYSYECADRTFEFGATDYTGVSADFGKWHQFDRSSDSNAMGIGFFPPTNFSIPTCGVPTSLVTVGSSGAPGGSAYFLSNPYTTPAAVSVGNGEYSLHGIGSAGVFFGHWATTGAVSVGTKSNPWTSLFVTGAGTVTAVFTHHPTLTAITFHAVPSGVVGVTPSLTLVGTGTPLANVGNGHTLSLPPGIYSIQGYAKPFYNFTSWSSTGNGVLVAAPSFPVTWLIVTGQHATATVTAHFATSTLTTTVGLFVVGNGSVSIGALTVSNSGGGFNFGSLRMPVGTYPTTITPAAGTIQTQILYGTSVVITDFALTTRIMFQNGSGLVEMMFVPGAPVTFKATPSAGGAIGLAGPGVAATVMSGTNTVGLSPGTYEIAGVPADGYTFIGWTTNNTFTSSFLSSSSVVTLLTLRGAATIRAHFSQVESSGAVTFRISPAAAGLIEFNVVNLYHSGQTNGSLGGGQYLVSALPDSGWSFSHWVGAPNVVLLTSAFGSSAIISVVGDGKLTAIFVPAGMIPVSFAVFNPEGTQHIAPGEVLRINHMTVHSGDTIWLTAGTYTIRLTSEDALSSWDVSSNLTLGSTHSSTTHLTVDGPGTVYAILSDSDHSTDSGGSSLAPHQAPAGIRGVERSEG